MDQPLSIRYGRNEKVVTPRKKPHPIYHHSKRWWRREACRPGGDRGADRAC
jgi:hypothetical protein